MKYTFYPSGVCSREYHIDIDKNGKIKDIEILGGCSGNLQGIMRLLKGMDAKEAAKLLKGIECGNKATSCPDQISVALDEYLNKK